MNYPDLDQSTVKRSELCGLAQQATTRIATSASVFKKVLKKNAGYFDQEMDILDSEST